MRDTLRKAAAVAFAATALAASTVLTGTSAQAASAASTDATPTCRTTGLRASLADTDPAQVGMSHRGKLLRLTNTSGRTCALRGYPGLGLEDAEHHPLVTETHWGSTYFAQDPGKRTLFLEPGQSAEADLAWAVADAPRVVHASYLEITPPASTTHLTLPFPERVTNGDLNVTAFAYRISLP
ncbi:DUF4232 domain-containing protein [Streptomyces sp. UNOC14_S4]|uniref:DUF4232 domain-containing protein n=1 Tax=Streptomyces sp. UNOC14_S4 TaxID=2872340 RepID=UPI001E288CE6|nr:DUF4232 domain-containing protein [Streptomyces sp. UNOC14_S4]MCC3772911.1 DUF4232 domain-containing protein [Streptomyces sp. UNOC14_S4]